METPRLTIGSILFLLPILLFLAIIVNGFLGAGVKPTDPTKYHVSSRVLETRTVSGLAANVEVVSMDKKPRLDIEVKTGKVDAGKSLTFWLVDSRGKQKPIPLEPVKLDQDGRREVEREVPDGAFQRYDRLVGKAGKRTVLRASLS